MVRSMTGFGEGRAFFPGGQIGATIKVVNHRYLSVRLRGLKEDKSLENKVEKLLKDSFSRGRVEAEIDVDRTEARADLFADPEELKKKFDSLRMLLERLGLEEKPSIDHLISLGAFEGDGTTENLWPSLREALEEAVEEVRSDQEREGEHLKGELGGFFRELQEYRAQVVELMPKVVEKKKERLTERLNELLEKEAGFDEGRIEEEVALLAEKLDLDEELSRIAAHLEEGLEALGGEGSVGKKLDFLAQELTREINTLGAKCKDEEVQSISVEMKLIVEKIKEQIRNVE